MSCSPRNSPISIMKKNRRCCRTRASRFTRPSPRMRAGLSITWFSTKPRFPARTAPSAAWLERFSISPSAKVRSSGSARLCGRPCRPSPWPWRRGIPIRPAISGGWRTWPAPWPWKCSFPPIRSRASAWPGPFMISARSPSRRRSSANRPSFRPSNFRSSKRILNPATKSWRTSNSPGPWPRRSWSIMNGWTDPAIPTASRGIKFCWARGF